VEDIFRGVKLHLIYLPVLQHPHKIAVGDGHGGGLMPGAVHIGGSVADDDGEQKCPAHQGNYAPPTAAVIIFVPVLAVLFVILIHRRKLLSGKTERAMPYPEKSKYDAVYHNPPKATRQRAVFSFNFL
jgi:hypothetical protein